MRWWGVVVAVLLATSAQPATLTQPIGTLASAQATTGASTNDVLCSGAAALVVQYVISNSATVQVENSIDNGATWSLVVGSPSAVSTKVSIKTCAGRYRTNVTAYTNGTVTTSFLAVNYK